MGVYRKGDKWYIDYYYNGRRKREAIGPDRKLAEAVLAKRKVEIAENRFLDRREECRTTFEQMSRSYLEWSRANKRSHRRDATSIANLLPVFGSILLSDIRAEQIERYKARRRELVKPATVNRELACLKHLYTKAIDFGYVDRNPAKSVKLLREDNVRVRYLTAEEEAALLEELAPHSRSMAILALNTGMRLGEVLGLRWESVDLENSLILLSDTKSGRRRELPINRKARAALERLPRHIHSHFVYCRPDGRRYTTITHGFARAVSRAGLRNVVFHTLRHTFASRLVMAGVDLVTVKELLGHASLAMVLRYAHLSPEHRIEAVARLDRDPPALSAAANPSGGAC